MERDFSALTEQLKGLEGCRVDVTTMKGETKRFIVWRSSGQTPVHIQLTSRRATSGIPADLEYRTVRRINRVRRKRA